MSATKRFNVAIENLRAIGITLGCLLMVAIVTAAYWAWADSGTQQPIAFPHKTHIALGLTCTTCHQRAEKDAVAGRPPTSFCLGCHGLGETDSDQIKALRRYGQGGNEVPWKRVWRLPAHVFFPHQVHVTAAKLACQTCHGPMESLTRPPAKPLKTLAMDDCISCHERQSTAKKAAIKSADATRVASARTSADCTMCHR